jgi:hypothetical protein
VSFTKKTITSGNVSFQVNTIVVEIDDGNPLPITPIESQTSSTLLSHGANSSVQGTPEEGTMHQPPRRWYITPNSPYTTEYQGP